MMAKWHLKLRLAASFRLIFSLLICGAALQNATAQIWSENFNSYPDATTQGAPKWTTNFTDCDDASANQGAGVSQWGVYSGVFTINDVEGSPCCPAFGGGGNDNSWLSEVINIAAYCNVNISMDISGVGVFECDSPGSPIFGCMGATPPDNSHDQILAEYRINGGAWIQWGYSCGLPSGTFNVGGLNGNTLQIRFFAANKANAEFFYIDNIVVNGTTAPASTFTPVGPLCANASPVVLPTTSNNGITGTWSPTTINPAGQGGNTITATFTPNSGQCGLPATMMVAITAVTNPMPAPIGPFCSNAAPVNLPTTVSGINGNWSGTGVSGNTFNPMTAGAGSFTLTFTPTVGQCANTASLPVTVNQAATPNLTTATLCSTDPLYSLTQLQDPLYPTGTWSGPGVTGSNFNPVGQNGVVNLTFTSNAACVLPANTSITVNMAVTPTITGVPASICDNASSINLPTPQGGFTGNWSGNGVAGNSFNPTGQSGSVTLTFTPTPGQCANPATTTITVNTAVTPAITGIPASICQNEAAISLPTNQGGVAGTWSGSGVSGNSFDPTGLSGSVTLTFTPNVGLCANPATTTITVNVPVTPAITGVPASICEDAAAINLPTTQGGFLGNWSGNGVSGNSFNPNGLNGNVTLTFTPNAGLCANPATTNIVVNVPVTPTITGVPGSICEDAASINLPTTQGGITGTWSGNGVSGNVFDPSGLSGSVTLTFTPTAGQCANPATTTINVTNGTAPVITGIPASICQNEAAINLPTTQSGVTGTWSGSGVSGNSFNPTGLSGNITLTFTPNTGQCANPATTSITVNVPTTPTITGIPASICENAAAINLPTTQSGVTGTWSGSGVGGNNFNPTGLSGNVTLTFTPNTGQCANPATTSTIVNVPTTPVITGVPASICENSASINLPTTQSGITGNWSGTGVSGNNFNPTGLSGNVTLTFTPTAGQCANPATTNINVTTPISPVITGVPPTICQTAPPINLPTTQGGFNGNWSGLGVSGNSFNPSGQSGSVTLTFTPNAGQCANPATTTITVTAPVSPTLATAQLCQNDLPLPLATLADPLYPNGTWSGPGVSGGNFNPAGQNGNVVLTFSPTANCTLPATTTVTVGIAPSFTALMEPCNLATQTYTVQFTITGGTAPYTVDGVTQASPNFTSTPIPSGTGYIFVIDDANGCGPVVVSGSQNCSCMTDAGTMNFANAPLMFCYNHAQFSVPFNQDQMLDLNDILQFVVHDNPGSTIGNIIATSNAPVINTPPGLVLGQTYYVSAIAGNNDGTGNVDFNDPCFSVSQGIPVIFYLPSVNLGNDVSICASDCYEIPLQFVGTASFYMEWTVYYNNIPVGSFSEAGLSSGSTVEFCPSDFGITSGTVRIEVTAIEDAQSCGISTQLPILNITITNSVTNNIASTLCSDESITVNGKTYNQANPSGTEIFPNGSFSGCDSIVNINLAFYPPAVFNLNQDICTGQTITVNGVNYGASNPTGTEIIPNASFHGCDSTIHINLTPINGPVTSLSQTLCTGGSLMINGTVYDESNPSGTEVIVGGAANGCDSTINVSLSFNSTVTSNIHPTLCPGGSITVNGTVYNAANPSGSENFPNGSYLGCDSVAMVNLTFYPPATGSFTQTLCTGGSITIGGTVFDDANPSGTVILAGASSHGCDSTVNVSLSFNSVVTSTINPTLCPGGSVTVNGTVYNQANPSGTETMPNGSYLGCDSVATVSLSFYPPAMGSFSQTFCTGGSVTIGGTVFNQGNPSGTVVIPNASINGCDSTVTVSLTFNQAVTNTINQTLCPDASITVNGTVYNQANPSGTETIPNGSYLGCDSIINVSLQFYPPAIGNFTQTLCTGGSVTIGGTVFDETNPSGMIVLQDASVHGCDSTINVSLSFNSVVNSNVNPTLCPGGSVTVNGTVYNQANPSGTETIPNGSYLGCDSVITVSLQFYPPAVGSFTQTICTGGSVTIGGTVFDETHSTGTVVLQGASIHGCDSTVMVTISFNSVVTSIINPKLCPGQSITVNGTVYNETNPSGTETMPNGSFLGCDSVATVNLTFFEPASSTIDDQFCTGGSITVNGTVYNEANPVGTEILSGASINGCDSTIYINLTFGSSVIVNLDTIVCVGESVVVNGMIYNANHTSGSETIPQGSYLGCDSTINVTLNFFPPSVGNVTEILQTGGSITVNGTVYDAQNPTGIEIFTGGSYTGCDSTVIISLTFEGAEIQGITEFAEPLCHFGDDGSITLTGIQGGTPPYVVALNGSNSTPVVSFPVVFDNLTFGFYTLTIVDALGNISSQEVFLPDAPPIQINMDDPITVPLGNSVTLDANTNTQIATWAWSPPDYLDCTDCPNPVSTPQNDIVYTVSVTDENGCTAEGDLAIIVEKVMEVYVPNAFSPNNDGFNDELTVFAGPQVENIKRFQIFSRWGELVFEKNDFAPNDLQLGWNGDFKDQAMDPAVFVWFAEVLFKDGTVHLFKGDVTLIK